MQRAIDRNITPKENLAQMPLFKAWISESRVEIDAARLLVMECAKKKDSQGLQNQEKKFYDQIYTQRFWKMFR
ncbi:MAG: hypothetical protein Ct9H300mP18_04520 [Candidatus Neomarinimicrobiota bacterium]|nr:MAG: hypothetical protein Ct9H300mP18_04520 [Candidatus Neomarinimicrobiota bacterium]